MSKDIKTRTVVHTIEGNSGDACQRNSYSVGSAYVVGYGTPSG